MAHKVQLNPHRTPTHPPNNEATRQPGTRATRHLLIILAWEWGYSLSLTLIPLLVFFFFVFLSQKDNYGWIMLTFQSKFTKATHSHPYLIRNLTIGLVKQLKFG